MSLEAMKERLRGFETDSRLVRELCHRLANYFDEEALQASGFVRQCHACLKALQNGEYDRTGEPDPKVPIGNRPAYLYEALRREVPKIAEVVLPPQERDNFVALWTGHSY